MSPYSLEVYGGVQNQVRGLAESLAATEDVSVIAPGRSVALGNLVTIGVGRVTTVAANGSRAPISLSPRSWAATRHALRDLDPDVVHIHEPFVPTVGLASLKSDAAPTVATFHRGGAGRFYPFLAPLLRADFARLAVHVAVSEEARATLRDVFGAAASTAQILPNAIDLERFSSAAIAQESRLPVVVFVGRHEPRKGLEVLLRAFGEGIADARLEVIGDGPEREQLERRFSRAGIVDFLGAIDDQAMAEHLGAAQVLVAPSVTGESFGVVLLEAMAARTAVVASAIPGYELAAGDAAAFVPPADAASLRRTLTELLARPDERADLVLKGIPRARSHSFSALARQYLGIYSRLLSA